MKKYGNEPVSHGGVFFLVGPDKCPLRDAESTNRYFSADTGINLAWFHAFQKLLDDLTHRNYQEKDAQGIRERVPIVLLRSLGFIRTHHLKLKTLDDKSTMAGKRSSLRR